MKVYVTLCALLVILGLTSGVPLNDGCDGFNPCGKNAECKVTGSEGRGATCECPAGTSGDPFEECTGGKFSKSKSFERWYSYYFRSHKDKI